MTERLEKLQDNWNHLGEEDPLWAILSSPDKRGNKWDLEEFLATGVTEIDALMQEIASSAPSMPRLKALDFGCGVGRLSRALSSHFDEVVGVDIAPSMVDRAQELNQDNPKCTFVVNDRPDLNFIQDKSIDLVYSNVTLQHIPANIAADYIQEFVRILSPNGLAVFQLPSTNTWGLRGIAARFLANPVLNILRRRKYRCDAVIELYAIPLPRVKQLIEATGGTIAQITDDDSAGPGWISYRYWVQRTAEK